MGVFASGVTLSDGDPGSFGAEVDRELSVFGETSMRYSSVIDFVVCGCGAVMVSSVVHVCEGTMCGRWVSCTNILL